MEVLVPHISCLITEKELTDELKNQFSEIYIYSAKGLFKQMKLKGGRHIRFPVKTIPNYVSAISEEYNFLPAGKIPMELLEQLVGFFKNVMTVKKADVEAMAHVLWNPDDGYHIAVPVQRISKASVSYDWEGYMKANDIIVLDIHSHNTMGAFFSGTDDRDDKKGIYYSAVVGNLDKNPPAIVCRFNMMDEHRTTTLDEIFEMPHKDVKVNPEWLEKVSTGSNYPVVPFPGRGMGRGTWANGKWTPSTIHTPNGTTGGARGQGRFAGFDDEDSYNFWSQRGARSESGEVSTYNPKTGTIQAKETQSPGWSNLGGVGATNDSKTKGVTKEDIKKFSNDEYILWLQADMATSLEETVRDEVHIEWLRQELAEFSQDTVASEIARERTVNLGEEDYEIAQYGEDASKAKGHILAWAEDLEGKDELIHEVLMYLYDMLSENAQAKLMMEGL